MTQKGRNLSKQVTIGAPYPAHLNIILYTRWAQTLMPNIFLHTDACVLVDVVLPYTITLPSIGKSFEWLQPTLPDTINQSNFYSANIPSKVRLSIYAWPTHVGAEVTKKMPQIQMLQQRCKHNFDVVTKYSFSAPGVFNTCWSCSQSMNAEMVQSIVCRLKFDDAFTAVVATYFILSSHASLM